MCELGKTVKVLIPRPRVEASSRDRLRIAAPAKINLNLLVGPRRSDGYHPLDSYVARITLYDEITLSARDDGRIALSCRGFDCGPDEQNLALRAATLLAERTGRSGARIELVKRIPPGSGLGGGSSDAAAVLVGLSQLWRLGLGEAELAALAAELGSDVPLFLGPPTVRMTGRGERIRPATIHPFWAVLCLPDISCSTAEVYRELDREAVVMEEQLDEGLLAGPPSSWRAELHNQLTPPALRVGEGLVRLRDSLSRATSLPVCMTGSGSGLFVLCDSRDEATRVSDGLDPAPRPRCLIVQNNPW